jgi:hypothetical protein
MESGDPFTLQGDATMQENTVESDYKGLRIAGWILAIVMPIVGFILGLVLVTREGQLNRKHGTMIIIASIGVFFMWLGAIG